MQGRGPGDRIASPYDTEARFRAKSGTSWTGYMVHITRSNPGVFARRRSFAFNILKANRSGTLSQDRYRAALADNLLRLLVIP